LPAGGGATPLAPQAPPAPPCAQRADPGAQRADPGAQRADPREAILDAALLHVAEEGWSAEALAAGAQDVGLRAASAGAFPRGPVELAWHAMRRGNEAASAAMQAAGAEALAALPVNARVRLGVRARLEHEARFARSWPQAMALGAQPAHARETARLLAELADEVWFWAGDRSTNLHWYSRRALLVGVFLASEAHMLADRSPALEDTWAFLDRRLEDAAWLGRAA